MLSSLRKGSTTWIAKLFIGLLILSFAVWGVSGLVLSSTNKPIAEVGDIEITRQDYQKMLPSVINEWNDRLKQRLTNQQLKAFDIPSQVKFRLINQAAVDSHVGDLNLAVSDNKIGAFIQNDPQLRDQSGRFNKELLKQILQSERISEQAYFNTQREIALRTQITSIFSQKKTIPSILLKSLYHHREDKRKVDYFVIPSDNVQKAAEPNDEQLKAYYETNKASYGAPEYRKVSLLELSLKKLAGTMEVSEKDLKKTYELRKKTYITPASRVYSQMTFETMEKAIEAHKALKGGGAIDEVAKKFGKGGKSEKIGPVNEASMADPKLAKAIFSLKEGDYTAPIDGTFAITIAKIDKASETATKPFIEARAELLLQLQDRAARKKINALYDRIEDLRGSGMEVVKVAGEVRMTAVSIDGVDKNGKGKDGVDQKDLPPTEKLLSAIFNADIGDDTAAIRHKDGGFVWFDVVGIDPKRLKPFDEVKVAVKEAWMQQENSKLAASFAAKVVKDIKDGKPFAEIAKSLRADVKSPEPFGRGGVAGDLPAYLVNKLFSVKIGGIESGLETKNKNWVIVKVGEALPAKEEGDTYKAYISKLSKEVQAEMTDDLVNQYIEGVKVRYGVTVNDDVFNQLKSTF